MRVLLTLTFWLFLIATVGALFGPVAFGLERYVIAGHSMTGTISYGSIVYSKAVDANALKVGDVITFVPPWTEGKPVTHRLIKIGVMSGQTVYQTKGDFNKAEDPGPITLERAAVYQFHVPVVGLAFIYMSRYGLFMIGLPALLVGMLPLKRLRDEASLSEIRHPSLKLHRVTYLK